MCRFGTLAPVHRHPVGFFLAFVSLLAGCHLAPVPHELNWDELPRGDQRARIVADAQGLIGSHEFRIGNRLFPYDCSGFVAAVLFKNGIDVYRGASELQIRGNGVRLLPQYVARYGMILPKGPPRPGDIVFFSHTYDRYHDGRRQNDAFTHIGIVEKIDDDGTITFIHNLHNHVTRYVMNLARPNEFRDENEKMLNSYLRRRRRSDTRTTSYLAGKLFAGFGSIVKDR